MKVFIVRAVIIVLISTPLYLLLRRPWRFRDKREITLGVFVIYLVCLFALTLRGVYGAPVDMLTSAIQRIHTGELINMTPLKTILGFLDWGSTDDVWVNIISNIVIFIPWGYLLPALWKRFQNPFLLISSCLGLTVFIEFFQLFIWRNTDIDDVILNFIGGLIGAAAFYIVKLFRKNKNNPL